MLKSFVYVFKMGEMLGMHVTGGNMALSFLAFLQAGLWAKPIQLKQHHNRALLVLQRYGYINILL